MPFINKTARKILFTNATEEKNNNIVISNTASVLGYFSKIVLLAE